MITPVQKGPGNHGHVDFDQLIAMTYTSLDKLMISSCSNSLFVMRWSVIKLVWTIPIKSIRLLCTAM